MASIAWDPQSYMNTHTHLQLSISKVQFCSSNGYLRKSIMQAAVVVILMERKKISVQMIYAHSPNAIRVTNFRDSITLVVLYLCTKISTTIVYHSQLTLFTSVQVYNCNCCCHRYPVRTFWALFSCSFCHLDNITPLLFPKSRPKHDPCLTLSIIQPFGPLICIWRCPQEIADFDYLIKN